MNRNNKVELDQFQFRLLENYNRYCERHLLDKHNVEYLVSYLIDHNIINATTIRRYTILKAFKESNGGKTAIVKKMADRFNISERSIYHILREHKNYFEQVDY